MPSKKEKDQKSVQTRVLPNSSEAESSLLGCILADGSIAIDICSSLSEEDFYYPANSIIFSAVRELTESGRAVDIVTLTEILSRNGTLEKAGGLNYLTSLGTRVPSAANAAEYTNIVLRTASMRKLIKSCSEIIDEAYTTDDAASALAEAEKRIYNVSSSRSDSDLIPVSRGLSEVIDKLNALKTDVNAFKGIPTGFWMLDKLTNGLHNGELIVIAGRPGTGKSSFAMNIVENAALKNFSCAVFSLEMPRVQIAQRLLCSNSGIPLSRMTGGEFSDSDKDWKSIYSTATTLSHLKIFIDDSSLITPAQLLSKCRRLKNREGLDLIVVDYIQLMTTGKKAENRQQEISEISRNLKILAKELDVPVIALSQMSRQIENRPGKPQLSDLRESGAIEQDADIVMFIHREKSEEDAPNKDDRLLIVAKHRNGALDEIPLKWIGELVKFVSYESDDVLRLKRYREELKEKKNKRNAVPDKDTDKENKGNAQNDIAPVPLPLTEEEKKIAAVFSSDNASPAPGKELGKLSLNDIPGMDKRRSEENSQSTRAFSHEETTEENQPHPDPEEIPFDESDPDPPDELFSDISDTER